jgi:hypothetical protein
MINFCAKYRKLVAGCLFAAFTGSAVYAPMKDIELPHAHVAGQVLGGTAGGTGTTFAASDGITVIHDEITGTPYTIVWKDPAREQAQIVAPSHSEGDPPEA